jgi:uncharacterized protein YjdB
MDTFGSRGLVVLGSVSLLLVVSCKAASDATPASVASVTVSLASPRITVGEHTSASATLRDASGNVLAGRSVAWSSSGPATASIDPSGDIAAVAPGTVSVVATSDGRSGSATLTVTAVPVSSIVVTLGSASLYVGQRTRATALIRDSRGNVLTDRSVVWTSATPSVATVEVDGIVTATGQGVATISATCEGIDGAALLTASLVPVATVEVSLASALAAGESALASATLRDAGGNVLSGRGVVWTSSAPTVASIDPSGVVTGTIAGTAAISATSADDPTRSGSAPITVVAGPPAQMLARSMLDQSAPPFSPVPDPPAVLIRDRFGNPVSGAPVSFTVLTGGGAPINATASSNIDGMARLGQWTLGAIGPQSLEASVPGSTAPGVTFVATARSPSTSYNVSLRFLTPLSPSNALAFQRARARIELIVTADVPDVYVSYPPIPLCGNQALSETVDDLLIFAEVSPIDGAGGILGRAGPCIVRSASRLPAVGYMQFDEADLASMEADGTLEDVVLHEMLHVVGFGSTWSGAGLIAGSGTSDPYFTGSAARAAFVDFNGGSAYPGIPVPVENTGASGTVNSHWRESVFGTELMTGWIDVGVLDPLSRTTVMSLLDLGYSVDPTRAAPFTIGAALRSASPHARRAIGDDTRPGPVLEIDARGVIQPVRWH